MRWTCIGKKVGMRKSVTFSITLRPGKKKGKAGTKQREAG